MKYFFLTIFVAVLLVEAMADDNSSPKVLPGFDHWELSFQIERSAELCTAIEISPYQRAAVKEMRRTLAKSGKLEQIWVRLHAESGEDSVKKIESLRSRLEQNSQLDKSEISRQLGQARIQNAQEQRAEINTSVFAAIDSEVRSSLSKILTEDQMQALLPTVMRGKFTSCFVPFSDPGVISFCGLQDSLDALRPSIERGNVEYATRIVKWRVESAQRILSALPVEAQQRFVDYAGNELALKFSCTNDKALLAKIPWHPIANISRILTSPDAVRSVGLSESQLTRLRAIELDFSEALARTPRNGQSPKDFVDELESVLHRSVMGTLSEDQTLLCHRYIANHDFQNNLNSPFLHQEFVKYLALGENALKEIKQLAAIEERNVQTLVCSLDGELFQMLCSKLPNEKQDRMLSLFSGIWDICVPEFHWRSGRY